MAGRNFAALLLLVVAFVGCGSDAPPAGISVADYTVHSKAAGKDMAVKVVVPEGGGERPLLVFLHGRSGDWGRYVMREVIPQVVRKYWNAHWRDYLRFYARALRRC